MKKTKPVYTTTELKLFKKIESGKAESLKGKDFDKEKIRFQRVAADTLKTNQRLLKS